VQGYRTVNISCTVWYSICNIYILLHVSTERCHPQGVIIPKVGACVGWYIDFKNMYSMNSRKLQNGWINMWTEGTVVVRGKDYTGITGVLAHSLVWKHNCWSGFDSTDCQEVLTPRTLGLDNNNPKVRCPVSSLSSQSSCYFLSHLSFRNPPNLFPVSSLCSQSFSSVSCLISLVDIFLFCFLTHLCSQSSCSLSWLICLFPVPLFCFLSHLSLPVLLFCFL
jgi:hypothetical protein